MGENVFTDSGKKGCYVAVKDLNTVIAYRSDEKWAEYAKYVGIAMKAENGGGLTILPPRRRRRRSRLVCR